MHVTQAELTAALISLRDPRVPDIRFEGYRTSSYLARDLLENIERRQRENRYAQPDTGFTETEIADALNDYGYGLSSGRSLARSVSDIIKKKRDRAKEPEWKAGDVVRSAKDKVLVRTTKGTWYRAEDGITFDDAKVRRPLTVLLKG